jgi:predicted nucleic acid-binding protein
LASLEDTVPEGDRLLLDSTTLIAYLDGGEIASPIAKHIIDEWVQPGRNPGIVSVVSVMELLVRPMRTGVPAAYRHIIDFLTRFPHLSVAVADLAVAQEAAALRASHGFRAPDALIIASGLLNQVSHLVTNDQDWKNRLEPVAQRVRVCYLTNHLPFPSIQVAE